MTLLDCLHAHRDEGFFSSLSAIHVNHGLNPKAGAWAQQCKAFCTERTIVFTEVKVRVPVSGGKGMEAAARTVRYEALNGLGSDWILLAHHLDDQAETLLLNLLRGSGVVGLAGMQEANGRYLRPMLQLSRRDILNYAAISGLAWIEDDSNSNEQIRRNFLRHSIMPVLARHFPAAPECLARTARHMQDADDLLAQLAQIDHDFDTPLKITKLKALPESRGINLLACMLRDKGEQLPGAARLREIYRQCLVARPDRYPRLECGGWVLTRFRDEIRLVRQVQHTPAKECLSWEGQAELEWRQGCIRIQPTLGIGLPRKLLSVGNVTFQARSGGERFRLHPGSPRRSLKDLFREAGIPPWQRQSLPLLYCAKDLVWVGGLGTSADWVAGPGEPGYKIEFDEASW